MAPRTGALVRGLAVLLAGGLLVAGCATAGPAGPPDTTAADGRGAVRPLPAPSECTTTVREAAAMDSALSEAKPGDRICILGTLDSRRLILRRSGSASAPIQVLGDGNTTVRGITVEASHVVVSGLNAVRPHAPGISLTGDDITLTNSTSISPRFDDGDGIRFFGHHIRIVHNTVRDVRNLNLAHADCMQTFATDDTHVASSDVRIEHNRCERISNQCLIAEGPHSSAGDGSGVGESREITFSDNFCEGHAGQALYVDDVRGVTVTGNEITGFSPKAFAFANKSTGARVFGNKIDAGIDYEVGMDDSSRPGYHGPEVGGDP
jgi:hypothetical protein